MQQVAIITGASSGIGRTCAEYLAQGGHIVYGCSRSRLPEKPAYCQMKLDVTDRESVRSLVQEVVAREKRIDLLVNNAGFGIAGAIEECSEEEIRAQFETNFFGSLNMIRETVPQMRRAGGGLIVTIGSIGGMAGLPFQGIYSATKFALMGLTESLRAELRPFNIRVAIVCPGDFKTGFTGNRRVCATSLQDSPYVTPFSRAMAQVERDESHGADPILVARLIEKIMGEKSPRVRYTVGKPEQTLFAKLLGVLPATLVNRIVAGHYGL
jgi:NAD(P)-dependent dehydrogenase (short-subunit alcohol dehydrogenase family)